MKFKNNASSVGYELKFIETGYEITKNGKPILVDNKNRVHFGSINRPSLKGVKNDHKR